MKIISKIQAKSCFLTEADAAISTVETVIIIIAVLAVIGVIFAFVINHILPANDKISEKISGMPDEMANSLIGSVEKQF